VLFQSDVDVDPVRPQVHIVHTGQIPLAERALFCLPPLGQLRDHRPRQALAAAQKLPERGHEIPRRQAVQVQQRQHLGDLRRLARPGRQDHRGEPRTLTGIGVDPLVVDPRHGHLHRTRAGQHLPRLVVPVTHHQAVSVFVPLGGEPGDVGVHLGLQRLGQHPPGTLLDDLVDHRRTARGAIITLGGLGGYGEHGRAFPTDAPTSVLLESLS